MLDGPLVPTLMSIYGVIGGVVRNPLEETVPRSLIPPNVGSELIKVNTLLNDEGDWDVNTINQSFPTSVAEAIFREKTPLFTIQSRISHTGKDLWMGTSQHLLPTNCTWSMMTEVKSGSGSGNVKFLKRLSASFGLCSMESF